jgi:hypothetical protein
MRYILLLSLFCMLWSIPTASGYKPKVNPRMWEKPWYQKELRYLKYHLV